MRWVLRVANSFISSHFPRAFSSWGWIDLISSNTTSCLKDAFFCFSFPSATWSFVSRSLFQFLILRSQYFWIDRSTLFSSWRFLYSCCSLFRLAISSKFGSPLLGFCSATLSALLGEVLRLSYLRSNTVSLTLVHAALASWTSVSCEFLSSIANFVHFLLGASDCIWLELVSGNPCLFLFCFGVLVSIIWIGFIIFSLVHFLISVKPLWRVGCIHS